MRASDADRERIVGLLHTAATEGRIGSDELEQRVSVALKARTYGELDALIADLPSSRSAARRRREKPIAIRMGGWAVSAVRANPWLIVLMVPVAALTVAVMITVLVMWTAVMVAGMVMGGGRGTRRPPLEPWTYRRDRRMYRGGQGRARSYWA